MKRMAFWVALAPLCVGCFQADHYDCREGVGYVAAPYYAPPAGVCGAAPTAIAQTAPPPLLNSTAVAATPPILTLPANPAPAPNGAIVQAGFTTAEPPR